MKKLLKRVSAFLLCGAFVFAAACDKTPQSDGGQPPAATVTFDIWSKSSAVNVMQDVVYDDSFKNDAAFGVSGGRGEYESSQLIITAGSDKAVNEYTLKVCDLKNGENVIGEEYIDVYNEKYIEVISSPAQYSTGLGWYADALLPFETAAEYGENKIDAGKNQGIYIEVFIPRDAAAGEYTGTFVLTVDGEKYDIPASVTVYDFEVSRESHLQTDWIVNLMAFGELDNTPEMQRKYFEAVAGYRASTHSMLMGAADADEWMETVRVYTNPNLRDGDGNPLIGEKEFYLAQINLPSAFDGSKAPAGGINYTTFDTYISRLVVASVEDRYDYLAKAGCYMGFIDEPHWNNTWDKVNSVSADFEARKEYWVNLLKSGDLETVAAKADLTEEEAAAFSETYAACPSAFLGELQESMSLVSNYITTSPDDRLDPDAARQFCYGTSFLSAAEDEEALANWTDRKISGNWWYAAGSSAYGNRLDSPRLEQRLSQWYTYDTGAKGYLIWEVAQYQQITWNATAGANSYEPCDAYSVAGRISNGAGDGYIFYPGKPYGIDGPVGSIRAHQYRDSHEEYEYFYLLGELYEEAGYSADAVLGKIFKSLYNNNRVTEDEDLFFSQREQVINLILLAQKGVFVTDYTEYNAQAKMQIVSEGTEKIVSVNGAAADAMTAEATFDMTKQSGDLRFETQSGLSFTLDLGGKAALLYDADTAAEVRGGVYAKETLEGNPAAKFTFTVDGDVALDRQNFDFTYAADKESVNAETGNLLATFYNPSDARVIVECWFVGTDGRTVSVDDAVLTKGYNAFWIPRLDLVRWSTIRSITGVRFRITMPEGQNECTVYCTGVYTVN